MGAIPPALFNFIKPMTIEQIASAIVNDLESGLHALNSNLNISIEQLEDETVSMREQVIREW